MKLYRCPKCFSYIDRNHINKSRKKNKEWITRLKCPNCNVQLKQTWVSMIYAWFVFGFMGYAALFMEGVWYLLPLLFFCVLIALAWFGKVYILDDNAKCITKK